MTITDPTATARQAQPQLDEATRRLMDDERVRECMRHIERQLEFYTMQYQEKYRRLTERADVRGQVGARADVRGQVGARADSRAAEGGVITPLPVPYLWFDLMAVGPFKEMSPGGPLQPNRIIQSGERAVLFAVLWRNPTPLAGGPSAAAVMAPLVYQVRGASIEINTASQGPAFEPPAQPFGPGFINIIPMEIPTAPQPLEGRPRIVEIHLTADVVGVGAGLPPFAAFATRWFQPDLQPGFLGQPDILPGFVEESPVRVLIYR